MNEPTVNIYLVDQETKRKLLFKVNPLMVGEAKNTTVIFPDGVEYKLVEAEPSDLFKTNKFFENHPEIFEAAANQFPDFGYPEKPVPSKDEQKTATREAFQKYTADHSEDEDVKMFMGIYQKDKENVEMVEELAFQKLGQWVTTNRSLVYAKKLQKERQQDPCYPVDYATRMVKIFTEINEACTATEPTMSFMNAIQKISQCFSDMHADFRRAGGRDMLMSVIRFYEPIQVMYKPTIEFIVKKHKEGDNIKINEIREADKEDVGCNDAFWKAFAGAMKQCLDKVKELDTRIRTVRDTVKKDVETKTYKKYFGIATVKALNDYISQYQEYNKRVQLISTSDDKTDIQELTRDMFDKGIAVLFKNLADIEMSLVLYFDGQEEDMDKTDVNDVFFAVLSGLPMLIQHNQNPAVTLKSTFEMCSNFASEITKRCELTEADLKDESPKTSE